MKEILNTFHQLLTLLYDIKYIIKLIKVNKIKLLKSLKQLKL